MGEYIETAPELELTAEEIENLIPEPAEYHAIYSGLFRRRQQRHWAEKYLEGLLSDIPRKSIEPMALATGDVDENGVPAMRQFISEGAWDDGALLSRHRQEVETDLGSDNGVLIVDGSDFLKKGNQSVGVKRQYCGEVGKKANCQAGVYLGYASERGYALLDRRLYLPEEWVESDTHEQRRKKCGVAQDICFLTKQQLALEMVAVAWQAKTLRCRWLTCDESFGRDTAFLDAVEGLGLWYFAEVPHDTRVWTKRPQTSIPQCLGRGRKPTREQVPQGEPTALTVVEVAEQLPTDRWVRHTIKEGSQGEIVADFAILRVTATRAGLPGPYVWLVLRGNPDSGELKTYLSNAPLDTETESLSRLSGLRWPIETGFEQCKQFLGMGDYEVRSWRGWHHHMTLCIVAFFFLVRLRLRLKKKPPA